MAKNSKPSKTSNPAKSDKSNLAPQQVELLYQALETELGGVEVYRTALQCVLNEDLQEEWEEYLEQTEEHVEKTTAALKALGLDPDLDTPGRQVVRHIGKSLVKAMQLALGGGEPEAAELVAAECVVLAETKDHMNWELIGKLLENQRGDKFRKLDEAQGDIEDEEDEHLYHSSGWARELWIQFLGMKAVLPPPEEVEDVKTAAEAAAAKEHRDED